MPRLRTPIPKGKDVTPSRNRAHVELRRSLVYKLALAGYRNAEIQDALARHVPPIKVDIDTIIIDKKAAEHEAIERQRAKREHLADSALAELEEMKTQALQAAIIARGAGNLQTHVQALKEARTSLMDYAKLAGILVERQEVQGAVANLNVNTEAMPEQLGAFRKALRRARLDDDGKTLDSPA
jgi:hypothetical protein